MLTKLLLGRRADSDSQESSNCNGWFETLHRLQNDQLWGPLRLSLRLEELRCTSNSHKPFVAVRWVETKRCYQFPSDVHALSNLYYPSRTTILTKRHKKQNDLSTSEV